MRKISILATLFAGVALVAAYGAYSAYVDDGVPEVNPSLVYFAGAGSWACTGGKKFDPPTANTYEFQLGGVGTPPHTVTINLAFGYTNGKLWFESTSGELVSSVLVKGGPPAHLYDYSGFPGGGIAADDGLVPPTNPHNGKPYGFSHVCFNFDKPPVLPPPD